jgi:hypothetical protein
MIPAAALADQRKGRYLSSGGDFYAPIAVRDRLHLRQGFLSLQKRSNSWISYVDPPSNAIDDVIPADFFSVIRMQRKRLNDGAVIETVGNILSLNLHQGRQELNLCSPAAEADYDFKPNILGCLSDIQ